MMCLQMESSLYYLNPELTAAAPAAGTAPAPPSAVFLKTSGSCCGGFALKNASGEFTKESMSYGIRYYERT